MWEVEFRVLNATSDILRKIGEEGLDILESLARMASKTRLFVFDILADHRPPTKSRGTDSRPL